MSANVVPSSHGDERKSPQSQKFSGLRYRLKRFWLRNYDARMNATVIYRALMLSFFWGMCAWETLGSGRSATMGTNLNKFLLLMWKNWKIQIRHPVQTFFEIGVPIFFCSIIVLVRSLVESDVMQQVIYKPYSPVNVNNVNKNFKTLAYSPNGTHIIELMEDVKKSLPRLKFMAFDNAIDMENQLALDNDGSKFGITFPDNLKNSVELPSKINVTIRFPSELHKPDQGYRVPAWGTDVLYPGMQTAGPREPQQQYTAEPGYYQEGFLTVQYLVNNALINYYHKQKGANFTQPIINMSRYPYPTYMDDKLLNVLQQMIGMVIVLAFIYTSISTIKMITIEKEMQLKEAMKIMGLPNWLHWTAWFVKTISFMCISITAMVFLFKIDFWAQEDINAIFPKCQASVLFVFFFLYACSTVTLCFAISVFFNQGSVASNIGGVIFFFFYLPYQFLNLKYQSLTLSTKLLASLTSNSALGYGFMLICMFEFNEVGMSWETLWKTSSPDDNLVLGHIFLMLILDSFLYLFVAIYVEGLFPGKYGVPKKWNFIFKWMFTSKAKIRDTALLDEEISQDPSKYENQSKESKVGIKIIHLRKVFANNKVGVRDLSLNMYENQITVLLGHNGAGKTTTMSMLTGMFPPTSGTAIINGYDIRTEIEKVRTSVGLCPQHNILFDELTVSEHIYFYSRLKGMPLPRINTEIKTYLRLLKLEDKANMKSCTLSGGMKRKLSVAVAFCGESKVVILDEPTAGMDPSARRALWDVVVSQKSGRTIMMTTHFMDEADLLGDRIAIVQNGKLQCCGSSYFLKKKYGSGYHLVIEKAENCSVQQITDLLRLHIPHVSVFSNVGTELKYLLKESDSPAFKGMFIDVENRADELGIASYGVSLTTLEDVFMEVGADDSHDTVVTDDDLDKPNGDVDEHHMHNNDLSNYEMLKGLPLIVNQIKAMFIKRGLITFRSWKFLIIQFIIPVALLSIAIASSHAPQVKNLPALDLNFVKYDAPITVIGTDEPNNQYYLAAKEYMKELKVDVNDFGDKPVIDHMLSLTEQNPPRIRQHYVVGVSINNTGGNYTLTGWYNNIPYHSPPLALSVVQNVVLKTLGPEYEIKVTNSPLPYTLKSLFKNMQAGNIGYQIALNLSTCMAFITAYYMLFYIRERIAKAKHLQFVSGINIFTFWMTSYIWDWCTYLITLIGIVITLIIFHEEGFYTADDLGRLMFIFVYFGYAILPVLYISSFLFKLPSMGFTRVFLFATVFGNFGFIIVQILSMEIFELTHVSKILDALLLAVPYYSFSTGIKDTNFEFIRYKNCNNLVSSCIKTMGGQEEICWKMICKLIDSCCARDVHYYSWEKPGILRNILASFFVGSLATVILILKEFKVFERVLYSMERKRASNPNNEEDDIDVARENSRIQAMTDEQIPDHALVLKDVSKSYKKHLAVNGLCLSVDKSECFGLLGVNGAGKTTTFRMMTGDLLISNGNIYIKGYNIKKSMKDAYSLMGYCPQFDALFDDLTARETLRIFCLIRGYVSDDIQHIIRKLSRDFDFTKHLDKCVKDLSGGNKRKLSAALALVGNPPVIFLDEPTTGMDPATKRYLWNALCNVRNSGKSLVLTSHSMEECEALCTRLAIMVNGRFRCLGSTQHLKNRFSNGYKLTIRLRKGNDDCAMAMNTIQDYIHEHFADAEVKEKHDDYITFFLPDASARFSSIFGVMEDGKVALKIEDYFLGQASLEEVFLSFTKEQKHLSEVTVV